jgi:prepilin-type N-terminal cleavage/methylation domain-containing protein
MKNNFKKAFSLIEISMVILVIGILIAGISKGVDLVYDMRLATARALTDKAPMFGMENLEMWLETTSENSLATGTTSFTNVKNPLNNDRIGRWNDINPTLINPNNKNHAVQGTLDYQPLYIQDEINGLPALLFDGINDFFIASNGKTNFNEFTIFIVAKPQYKTPATGTYSNVINISCSGSVSTCARISASGGYSSDAAGNPAGWIYFYSPSVSDKNSIQLQYSMTTYSGAFVPKYHSIPFVNNNNGLIALVNHGSSNVVVEVSPSYKSTSASFPFLNDPNSYLDFRIGMQKTGFNTRNFKGYLSEIILFGRSLNDQETLLIKNYLSEKWRIKL